jgi:hypothetical protein
MAIAKTATTGLLRTIAWLHPEYSSLIGFLLNHEDQLVEVGPIIQEAAQEGPGALQAAETAAPDLAKAIKDFVQASPVATDDPKTAAMHAENITRKIVGSPCLTPDQEQQFLSQDSRSGSG